MGSGRGGAITCEVCKRPILMFLGTPETNNKEKRAVSVICPFKLLLSVMLQVPAVSIFSGKEREKFRLFISYRYLSAKISNGQNTEILVLFLLLPSNSVTLDKGHHNSSLTCKALCLPDMLPHLMSLGQAPYPQGGRACVWRAPLLCVSQGF